MGRPRQPYCPDCLRAGRQTLKAKGIGYCADCRKLRQSAYNNAGAEESEDVVTDYIRKQYLELKDQFQDQARVIEVLERANNRLLVDPDSERRRAHRAEIARYRTMVLDRQERLNELDPDNWCHPNDLPEDW